nr:hypothetical protein BaRGS_022897 [Batillaria attramentaria]
MTETTMSDASGCKLSVVMYRGEPFPPFPVEAITKLDTFQFRDDDIIVSAYPKAVDYGSFFDYTLEWENALNTHPNLNVLRLVYEDLKENPETEISRMARFLGKDYDSSFIKSVCEKCAFHSMRERKGDFDRAADGQPIMYRKGQVGDWQNWFTSDQVRQMDQVYQDKLAGLSMMFRYTLNPTQSPDSHGQDFDKTVGTDDINSNNTESDIKT